MFFINHQMTPLSSLIISINIMYSSYLLSFIFTFDYAMAEKKLRNFAYMIFNRVSNRFRLISGKYQNPALNLTATNSNYLDLIVKPNVK